ncbi:MAG: hypothetical protein IPJ60_12800 [Sphingobacteriaceae bacterium]|nr:hypothetical protein [Sphingobacteriaceae bacterium]
MKNNSYIKKIIDLNDQYQDRYCFHEEAGKLLSVMAKDKEFWNEVVKQNFTDKGYLNRKWTMYDIPFLYVYECDDFYVKVHLFVPLVPMNLSAVVASAIHHHNNYMLTSCMHMAPDMKQCFLRRIIRSIRFQNHQFTNRENTLPSKSVPYI